MARLTKDQARKLIRNKLPVCEYCKSVFKTDKLLLEHLKEVHGKHKIVKRTRKKRRVDQFKPKEVYKYWTKNKDKWKKKTKNPYNKKDIRDLVVAGYMNDIPILYIWDNDKEKYRIYTDSMTVGYFKEIVYNTKTLKYTIKGWKKK